MKRIVSWVIEVEWEDGTTEKVADVPSHVANEVDGFLTMLEEEADETRS